LYVCIFSFDATILVNKNVYINFITVYRSVVTDFRHRV